MENEGTTYESGTYYRIELQGQVDVDWLRSLNALAEGSVDELLQMEKSTVLYIRADQSAIVGLVRDVHGLGMTILQFQMIIKKEN